MSLLPSSLFDLSVSMPAWLAQAGSWVSGGAIMASNLLVSLFPASQQAAAGLFLHPWVLMMALPSAVALAVAPNPTRRLANMVGHSLWECTKVGSFLALQATYALIAGAGLVFVNLYGYSAERTEENQQSVANANAALWNAVAEIRNNTRDYFAYREAQAKKEDSAAMKSFKHAQQAKPSMSKQFEERNKEFNEGHEFLCPIGLSVMDIPVKLVESQQVQTDEGPKTEKKVFYFDYVALKEWYKVKPVNPLTKKPFFWRDLKPATGLVKKMQEELDSLEPKPDAPKAPVTRAAAAIA